MKLNYRKIYKYCFQAKETDCVKLFNEIADLPYVPIHGPIHHYIVPSVMLTCYNNIYGDKYKLKPQLIEAYKRSKVVPGGNCASCGYCGAAAGVGIFLSIILNNNPLEEESWSKVMEVSATVSKEIAKNGGPRCCKRDSYIAIITAVGEIEEKFGIQLSAEEVACKYFLKNEQCRKAKCLFFPKKKKEKTISG